MRGHKTRVQIDVEKILQWVDDQGYGISEFAKIIDVPYVSLYRYFKKRYLPHDVRLKIANELGRDISEFLLVPVEQEQNTDLQTAQAEHTERGTSDMNTSRRAFLQLGIGATGFVAGVSSSESPDSWQRLSKALEQPKRIDAQVIEHLITTKDRCYHLLPGTTGFVSKDLRNYVQGKLNSVVPLLERSPAKYQQPLQNIACELISILGRMDIGLDDYEKALLEFQVALDLAQETGNEALQALVSDEISFVYMRNKQYTVALDYSQKVLSLTLKSGSTLTPLTISSFAAQEAEIQSYLKNEQATLKALERARVTGNSQPEDDPYLTTFGPVMFAGYQGDCYLNLGKFREAEQAFLNALALPQNDYRRAIIISDLAKVYVKQGNIDAASMATIQTIELANQTSSPRITRRTHKLYHQLTPWGDSQAVLKTSDAMKSFGLLKP